MTSFCRVLQSFLYQISLEMNQGESNLIRLLLSELLLFFCMGLQPPASHSLLISEVSRSHSDTPLSLGILWTSDQPVEETSTLQHTAVKKDQYPCPGGIRTHNPSKRTAADPRLKLLSSLGRLCLN